MSEAKNVIQNDIENMFNNGIFHVICSSSTLEYATRTTVYCINSVMDGTCYAFQTSI